MTEANKIFHNFFIKLCRPLSGNTSECLQTSNLKGNSIIDINYKIRKYINYVQLSEEQSRYKTGILKIFF